MRRWARDAVGGMPDQEQCVLDLRPVMASARVLRGALPHLRMVEEPHRVFAIVAGRCCEGIEQLALLLDGRCLAILRDHLLKEFTLGLQTRFAFHVCLPWKYLVQGTFAIHCLTKNRNSVICGGVGKRAMQSRKKVSTPTGDKLPSRSVRRGLRCLSICSDCRSLWL
jgi:hypothetical protein